VSLGLGLGLATVSPWIPSSTPPAIFGIAAGIWLIITQWLSAGLGGYLAARLLEKWVGVRTDEVLFRDTADGLLVWALATIIVIALLVVGSAVAGAVAAATTAPAAPVSPEAAEAARNTAISFSFLFLFLSASSSEPSRARSAVITVTKSRADLTAKRYLCQP
jgi:hypothetical protein